MQLESQNSPFLSSPISSSAPSPSSAPASPANCYLSSSSTSSSSYNEAGMAPISLSSARNLPEAAGKTTSPEERPGDGRCSVAGRAIERVRFIDRVGGDQTGWKQVEERFDRIAWIGPGGFPVVDRSDFGHCIGEWEARGAQPVRPSIPMLFLGRPLFNSYNKIFKFIQLIRLDCLYLALKNPVIN